MHKTFTNRCSWSGTLNIWLVAFLAVWAGTCSAALTPQPKPVPGVVRGPYLQSGTTNSMVVRWRTDIMGPSIVRYGLSPTNLKMRAISAGQLTEHVVLLTNLAPDTRYYYQLGTNDVPILATLTNRTLLARTTNGALAISTTNRSQLSKLTNGAFFVRARRNSLAVSNALTGYETNIAHRSLVLTTTNYSLVVTLSNRALHVSTTNTTRELVQFTTRSGRVTARDFIVAATNVISVGGDENTFFYTPPAIGNQRPLRIWVVGDPGTRRPAQYHVRDGFLKYNAGRPLAGRAQALDVWLLLGDNAYTAGTDAEYQGSIFAAYQALLKNWVLWPSLGNHDAGSANSPTQSGVYYDIFTLPTLGQAGGVMSGSEAYYSFDYGNVHFIAIDSANSDRSTNGMMYRWLKQDLAANKQDWCIAFCHHPPYTKGSHDSDRERDSGGIMSDMRSIVVPLLEEGGVDILLTGHSHAYERSYLLDSHYSRSTVLEDQKNVKSDSDGRRESWGAYHKPTRGPAPHEGTLYIVAGSSGQVSGGSLLHPAMYAGLNVHGSLVLDVQGAKLQGSFIDTNGLVRDHFTVTKGAEYAAAPRTNNTVEQFIETGGRKIPARLRSLIESQSSLFALTNARPSDEELLLELFDQQPDTDRATLAWALGWIGDADAVVTLMKFLTNGVRKASITAAQEDARLQTVEALGFLASRYEAPYLFLRRGTDPEFWDGRRFWTSPRGPEGYRALATASIRALGLSGRPEAQIELLSLRKKAKSDSDTTYTPRMRDAIEVALRHYDQFQKLGPTAFQRSVLRSSMAMTRLNQPSKQAPPVGTSGIND